MRPTRGSGRSRVAHREEADPTPPAHRLTLPRVWLLFNILLVLAFVAQICRYGIARVCRVGHPGNPAAELDNLRSSWYGGGAHATPESAWRPKLQRVHRELDDAVWRVVARAGVPLADEHPQLVKRRPRRDVAAVRLCEPVVPR